MNTRPHIPIYNNMYIDLFICVLAVWAIYNGWNNGFVKEIFSTLGVIAGLVVAAIVYNVWGKDFLAVTGSETNMVLSVGMFLILWILLPLVFGLVANVLTRAIKGIQLGFVNSLLGVVFSVGKFALLLSCVLNMMTALDILGESKKAESHLYEPAVQLLPFVSNQVEKQHGKASETEKNDTLWVDFNRNQQSQDKETSHE